MTLDRQTKEALLTQYQEGFASATNAFVLGFQGITVPQDTELRAKIRASGGSYEVVKNRLALIAIRNGAGEPLAEHFSGPTSVAYSAGDVVALAKTLTEFAKTVPAIQFKAGLLEGAPVGAGQIKQIAELPSREELLAKLVFMLQSPIARMVRGLGAITPQFVRLVEQIRLKKEAGSE